MTFTRRDRLALSAGLLNIAMLVLLVGVWLVNTNAYAGAGTLHPDPIAAHVNNLMSLHHCWTGSQVAPVKVPGHVVETNRSGHVIYGGARLVRAALDNVFKGTHLGLTVAGFCR